MQNKLSPYQRLEALRMHYKLDKTSWTARLGVSMATYNNWRLRGVPAKAVPSLMEATGLSYDDLMTGIAPADPYKRLDKVLQDLLIVGRVKDELIEQVRAQSALALEQYAAFQEKFKRNQGGTER